MSKIVLNYDILTVFGEDKKANAFVNRLPIKYTPKYYKANLQLNFIKTFDDDMCIGYSQTKIGDGTDKYATGIWIGKMSKTVNDTLFFEINCVVKRQNGEYQYNYLNEQGTLDIFKVMIDIQRAVIKEELKREFLNLLMVYVDESGLNKIVLERAKNAVCRIYSSIGFKREEILK